MKILNPEINKKALLKAWIQKYFSEASLHNVKYFPINKIGINLIKASSTPTQAIIQLAEVRVTKGPKNIINKNNRLAEDKDSDCKSCLLTSITSVLPATILIIYHFKSYTIYLYYMQQHPFHLVEYSPWPLLGSFAILSIPVGLVYYIKTRRFYLLTLGTIAVTLISYLWWRDITRESTLQGFHSLTVVKGLKTGVFLFIVSEVCFFFAFFWAYFHSRLAPAVEIGSVWPPIGIITLETFQVPLLNTSVLLLSGVRVTWAHHAIEEGNHKRALKGLALTLMLGFYFVWLQYGEYIETSFSIADRVYGSAFFIATGFHGLHVLVGATFLTVCFVRLAIIHFDKNHHVGFLGAAWYWHFVDVVWLFLYVRIYWWGSICQSSLYKALIL